MAQDGWYEFDRCVPVDTVALADVQAGEILTREWSFAVNAEPRIASRVVSGDGTMDPRNILTGVDGMLYNEDGDEMATINQWRMEVNFTNADYQAAGQWLEWSIPTGYNARLTFTEAIVNDEMIGMVFEKMAPGDRPDFSFRGRLAGHGQRP